LAVVGRLGPNRLDVAKDSAANTTPRMKMVKIGRY
jgi:hypothetical protein